MIMNTILVYIGMISYGEQVVTAMGAKFRVNESITVELISSYDSNMIWCVCRY